MSASLLMLFNWLEGGQVLAGEYMGQVVICGFSFKEMCPGWWMVIQKKYEILIDNFNFWKQFRGQVGSVGLTFQREEAFLIWGLQLAFTSLKTCAYK